MNERSYGSKLSNLRRHLVLDHFVHILLSPTREALYECFPRQLIKDGTRSVVLGVAPVRLVNFSGGSGTKTAMRNKLEK